jgi:rhodanese-related sulfurtransferase
MQARLWPGVVTIAILLALLVPIPLLSACGGPSETPTTPTIPPATGEAEFDIMQAAVAAYLTDIASDIKASDLQMRIATGDAPYIVSLRGAEDYAQGHIPGAVNLAFSELTTLPKDKEILLYCYTGQSSSFGTAVLGVLDYDVQNLLYGMSGWSADPAVYVSRFDPEKDQGSYQVETTANEAGTYDYPKLDNTASNNKDEIIKAAALTVVPKYITAADLNMKIAQDKDMTILSVRSAEDYAAGHIPRAINFGLSSLADNLGKLDPDAPVYVYCYTGDSAAQAAALLQMLGYDAYSLKFGMCSWSADPAVNTGKCFDAAAVQGYEVGK